MVPGDQSGHGQMSGAAFLHPTATSNMGHYINPVPAPASNNLPIIVLNWRPSRAIVALLAPESGTMAAQTTRGVYPLHPCF